MVVVDVPLNGERALAAARPPSRFDLVGLHWQGRGTVSFRTRGIDGGWSAWHTAAPEAEDLPNRGSAETRAAKGWHLGNPWWTGPADGIEYRLRGSVRRLRAFLVRSPQEATPTRTFSVAGAPAIVTRAGWQADESIVRFPPQYADAVRLAIVHHTAGSNTYTQAEAPAVVRGIELYHVQGNGWNDIGYNLLVDRFGTVYEGRAGGVDRNVVGAHALGFNTGSVGIAVLGSYGSAAPSAAAQDALVKVLAWRLDLAHVDPVSTLTVVSGGSERFPAGIPVFLRAVSGHRDTGLTECPGNALYGLLDTLAARAAATGGPKIYAPTVTGQVGGPVRFRARLSASRAWTITVTDAAGFQAAAGGGTGTTVDWTWDSSSAPPGVYGWQITVSGATPATGSLAATAVGEPTLSISGAAADPETISPNGDGIADSTTISYTTTAEATVTVSVLDSGGSSVAVLQNATPEPAGAHAVPFDGAGLPAGRYGIRIDAADSAGKLVSATVDVLVSRTLDAASVSPTVFSPNGDGRNDSLTVRFDLATTAEVRIRILRAGAWVATLFSGELAAGPHAVRWDGSKHVGKLLDGSYTAVVEATDAVTTSVASLPFASDTRVPVVRILRGRPLRVWVSKPATLTLRVDGTPLTQIAPAPGVVRVHWQGPASHVRVVAWDSAGNVSRPAARS
jgi:flagellar hook assembly protein FlgD